MRYFFAALAACIALAGCSNHPIVDDVTPYSTSDVVNKVRCEVLAQLLRYVDAGRLQDLHQRFESYDADRNKVKYASKSVLEIKEVADRIVAQSKEILIKEQTRPKRQAALNKESDKLDKEIDQLIEAVRTTIREVRATDENDRVGLLRLQGRLTRFQADVRRLAVESERIAARQRELDAEPAILEEQMQALLAEARELERKDGFKAYQEYKEAADRLAQAKKDLSRFGSDFSRYYAFATTNVALQFRFQITENNNGSGAGSIVWPVALGTVTLGYSAGKTKSRLSERTVGVSEDFADLLRIESQCKRLDFGTEPQSALARTYPVTGNIGIGELIDQFLRVNHAVKLAKRDKDSKDKKVFHEKLQFTTTLKGGLKPSLVLSPSNGHTVKFDGDFNSDRSDLHEVIVDILPGIELADAAPEPKEPKDAETKISLVKVPNLSIRLLNDGEWPTSTTAGPGGRGSSEQ